MSDSGGEYEEEGSEPGQHQGVKQHDSPDVASEKDGLQSLDEIPSGEQPGEKLDDLRHARNFE